MGGAEKVYLIKTRDNPDQVWENGHEALQRAFKVFDSL